MALNDLQQSLESSSPQNTGNNSSQPDMSDIVDMLSTSWDDTSLGVSDFMNIDTTVEGHLQTPGDEHDPERPSCDHLISGLPEHIANTDEVQDSGLVCPASIFGGPLDKPSDVTRESESAAICKEGPVAELLARDDTPMQLEDYGATSATVHHDHILEDDVQSTFEDVVDIVAADELNEVDDLDNITKYLEDGDLDGQGLTRRKLRPHASNPKRKFTSTWIDKDDSGNYDPKGERQLRNSKRARKNALSHRQTEAAKNEVHESDTTGSEALAETIASDEHPELNECMVILTFTTEEGIEAFKKKLASLVAQRAKQGRGRRLRKRSEDGVHQHQPYGGQGPANLPIDFRNKPIARCCWSCAHISGEQAAVIQDGEADCSLATNPGYWPCIACFSENIDCVLINEPIQKMACQDCKRQRVACSYSSTRNHRGPCQQCKTAGHQCVAGPVKDAIVPRLGYKAVLSGGFPVLNDNQEQMYTCDAIIKRRNGKQRRLPDCAECSEARVDCRYGSDGGACHECSRTGQACTIPDKDSSILGGSKRAGASGYSVVPSRFPTPGISSDDVPRCGIANEAHGPKGVQRRIVTSFSHPVSFNCDDEEPRNPCHFCIQPRLPLFGFGKTEALVIDFNDSSGFVELAAGHRGRSIEPMALCTACTTSRLSVVMCDTHKLTPIPDIQYTLQDEERVANSMFDGTLKAVEVESFCSVCPSLATLQCSAGQEDGPDGCGLKLCARCTATLVGHYEGVLGEMLAHEEGTPSEGLPLGFRADAELLTADGVLMRYLTQLSEKGG